MRLEIEQTNAGVHSPPAQVLPRARTHSSREFFHNVPVRDRVLLAIYAVYFHGGVQALPFAGSILHHEQVCVCLCVCVHVSICLCV